MEKQTNTICYCRVSSPKQRDDLARQVEFMRARYPEAEIVKNIVRYLNYKRKGLKSLLGRAMRGDKLEVVVAHKDRLARFGFELIEWVIQQNAGKIVVLKQTNLSPEQELTNDLLSILHVFK
ncbi:MAG: IS607 family transposase [Candidatus Parabeggiatoa sp. nov. 2]|nr:MAG: IS607 family transposase [Gammaproteobacteria bacterium]